MKTTWIPFERKDFYNLNDQHKVKLINGQIKSFGMRVGTTLYDSSHNEINPDDILFFAKKENLERYKKLQKHYEIILKYDEDTLDELSFAISSSLNIGYNSLEDEKLTKLFKKLGKYIRRAEESIIDESKTYL